MKYYHITKSCNVNNILKNGLVPTLGDYALEMGEYEPSVWLFIGIDEAEEMAPVWLEPFYGDDLVMLEVDLPDNFPIDYTGSDYEVVSFSTIPPQYISLFKREDEGMTIKEIRTLSGLSRRGFSEQYHIPVRTIECWESENQSNKRNCPVYVKELLERVVRLDFGSSKGL